jgi:serine/threonine-protein kinase
VPAAVDELIQRACAKDRDQRFQTAAELVAALDRLLGVSPPEGAVGAPVTTSKPGEATAEATPRRRVWPWVMVAVVLLGGGAGAAVAFGWVPGVRGIWKPPRAARSAVPSASAPPRTSASALPSVSAPRVSPALASLTGAWVGNGRELEAVLVGGDLEFRVKKPQQFAPQGYEVGEARFVLRAIDDGVVFEVEDRIRPVPPIGKTYDPRARGTCQEVWTSAGSDPLRARFDGKRLSVEFAKIEPGPANFTTEGAKVTSCVGLRHLKASTVVSVLTRP